MRRVDDVTNFVRFMRSVEFPEDKAACWVWTGASSRGYGIFSIRSRTVAAHRWIYEFICGPIPDGEVMRHKCDNPQCVHPQHLEPGTISQNARDAVERGRWAYRKGSKHPMASLTEPDVLEIRRLASMGVVHRTIATQFSISDKHVSRLVRRTNWSHI